MINYIMTPANKNQNKRIEINLNNLNNDDDIKKKMKLIKLYLKKTLKRKKKLENEKLLKNCIYKMNDIYNMKDINNIIYSFLLQSRIYLDDKTTIFLNKKINNDINLKMSNDNYIIKYDQIIGKLEKKLINYNRYVNKNNDNIKRCLNCKKYITFNKLYDDYDNKYHLKNYCIENFNYIDNYINIDFSNDSKHNLYCICLKCRDSWTDEGRSRKCPICFNNDLLIIHSKYIHKSIFSNDFLIDRVFTFLDGTTINASFIERKYNIYDNGYNMRSKNIIYLLNDNINHSFIKIDLNNYVYKIIMLMGRIKPIYKDFLINLLQIEINLNIIDKYYSKLISNKDPFKAALKMLKDDYLKGDQSKYFNNIKLTKKNKIHFNYNNKIDFLYNTNFNNNYKYYLKDDDNNKILNKIHHYYKTINILKKYKIDKDIIKNIDYYLKPVNIKKDDFII